MANRFSPAELMIGRKLKSLDLILPSALETDFNSKVKDKKLLIKRKQIENYNTQNVSRT